MAKKVSNKEKNNSVRNSSSGQNGRDGSPGIGGIGANGLDGADGRNIMQKRNSTSNFGNINVIDDGTRYKVTINGVTIVDINKEQLSNNTENTGDENE